MYKYKYKQGYLDAGNDINEAAVSSLEEAQTVCNAMLECVGFTFQDTAFSEKVASVVGADADPVELEMSQLDASTISEGKVSSDASPMTRKIYFKQSGAFTKNSGGWHAFVKDGKYGGQLSGGGAATEEVDVGSAGCSEIIVTGSTVQKKKMGIYKEAIEHTEASADGTPTRKTYRYEELGEAGGETLQNYLFYVVPEDKKATGDGNWMLGGTPGKDDGWAMVTDSALSALEIGGEWQSWDGLKWMKEPEIVLSCAETSADGSSSGTSGSGTSSDSGNISGEASGSCKEEQAVGVGTGGSQATVVAVVVDAATGSAVGVEGAAGGAAGAAARATELRLEAALAEARAGARSAGVDSSVAGLQQDLRVYQAELQRLRSELTSTQEGGV
jgi:hypothetical protein